MYILPETGKTEIAIHIIVGHQYQELKISQYLKTHNKGLL